jgi:hypothetical protein
LSGDEIRVCWEAAMVGEPPATVATVGPPGEPIAGRDRTPVRSRREFVPVATGGADVATAIPGEPEAVMARVAIEVGTIATVDAPARAGDLPVAPPTPAWSLFPELDE